MKKLATLIVIAIFSMSISPLKAEARRRYHRNRHHVRVETTYFTPFELLLGACLLGAALDDLDESPRSRCQGWVDCDVMPEEAKVFINGAYVGTADDLDGYPSFLYLTPGEYRLTFQLSGYRTWSHMVRIRPGRELSIDINLQRMGRNLDYEEEYQDDDSYEADSEEEGPLSWED